MSDLKDFVKTVKSVKLKQAKKASHFILQTSNIDVLPTYKPCFCSTSPKCNGGVSGKLDDFPSCSVKLPLPSFSIIQNCVPKRSNPTELIEEIKKFENKFGGEIAIDMKETTIHQNPSKKCSCKVAAIIFVSILSLLVLLTVIDIKWSLLSKVYDFFSRWINKTQAVIKVLLFFKSQDEPESDTLYPYQTDDTMYFFLPDYDYD